jgi:hypothetical protein
VLPVVSLKQVVGELELISDVYHTYLDKRSGEFVGARGEDLRDAESDESYGHHPGWQKELIAQAREVLGSDHFIELPSAVDIDEYEIMERFIYSIASEDLSERLLEAIRGRGAFRRFKDVTFRYGLESDWHSFRRRALEEIAIEWLEANDFPWRRYTGESDAGSGGHPGLGG